MIVWNPHTHTLGGGDEGSHGKPFSLINDRDR